MNNLLALFLNFIVITVLDLPFLTFIMTKYRPMINNITGKPMAVQLNLRNVFSVLVAYTLMSLGLQNFASDDWSAALLGMIIYGLYSFTNMVIFPEWNPWVALIETLWGGILFFLARRSVLIVKTLLGY